jgi:hypothetical protein
MLSTVALVVGLAIGASPQVIGQSTLVEVLRKEIPESERLLLNVRVDGKSQSELWDASINSWKYSGEVVVSAWYTGAPGSRVRIDFHELITLWTGGAAPFFSEAFTMAYDGHLSRKLSKRGGPPGQQHDYLEGKVRRGRDALVELANWATGWAYSLYGFFDHEGKRLSSIFDLKDFILAATEAEYEGVKCIRLEAVGAKARHTWHLDPARGYAILGYERANPQPPHTVWTRLKVEQLVDAAPGIYYPTKGFAEGFLPDGTPVTRSRYEAFVVLANDPGFSEQVFTIEWPAGVTVYDETTDHTVTPSIEDHDPREPIDGQFDEVRSEVAKLSNEPEAPGKSRIWPVVAGISVVVVLLLAFAVRLGRKK